MTPLLVALGAAAGASLRFLLGTRYDRTWHRGTFVANVLGSFLLGLFSALALSGHAFALLGTGFCGGFTTYSSFAVQSHDLGARRGAAYVVATVGLGLAACTAGWMIGQA
ncbi:CrcB family protein [Nocardioides sp. YIM 152315]|uniref:fluoride efflux transporter FluC n=1 Tax=Nocardioides sp. YIM 152315 TaxID=3031760 RepID=UPI0023DCC286|nr:CrcB family protein [Nocardioides sp. YIM 152315]MDF1605037.1 CrcB family protein [Nocardioides sp. YIM 152315]